MTESRALPATGAGRLSLDLDHAADALGDAERARSAGAFWPALVLASFYLGRAAAHLHWLSSAGEIVGLRLMLDRQLELQDRLESIQVVKGSHWVGAV